MPDYGVHNSLLVNACREGLWFWDVVILLQTFAISTALVFSTRLNTHYQLSIMLMIMLAGITALAHMAPFKESLSQRVQVNTACNDRTTLALLLATQNQHCSPATRLVRALTKSGPPQWYLYQVPHQTCYKDLYLLQPSLYVVAAVPASLLSCTMLADFTWPACSVGRNRLTDLFGA